MSTVFRVATEHINPLWPKILPLVERALKNSVTHDAESIRIRCMSGDAQLWLQWDEPIPEAVIVSEFVAYPKGLFIRAWLAASDPDCQLDGELIWEQVEHWRKMHNVRGLEIIGRFGWLKRVPGLEPEGLVMRKVWD